MLSRKLQLLIVDDDPAIVRLAVNYAQAALQDRAEIVGLVDPQQACTWLADHCCDILISDIVMPGMSGMDLLKVAKRRNAWTLVNFMTAHSTWDFISEAIEAGASDYILKPLDRDDFIKLLKLDAERFGRWQSAVLGTLSPEHRTPVEAGH